LRPFLAEQFFQRLFVLSPVDPHFLIRLFCQPGVQSNGASFEEAARGEWALFRELEDVGFPEGPKETLAGTGAGPAVQTLAQQLHRLRPLQFIQLQLLRSVTKRAKDEVIELLPLIFQKAQDEDEVGDGVEPADEGSGQFLERLGLAEKLLRLVTAEDQCDIEPSEQKRQGQKKTRCGRGFL